jgi:tetratricopeptide (TPR) repeat protein
MDPKTHLRLAEHALDQGDLEQGTELYIEVRDACIGPGDMPEKLTAMHGLGRCASMAGDFYDALILFHEAMGRCQYHNLSEIEADIYLDMGIVFTRLSDFDRAQYHFDSSIRANPCTGVAYSRTTVKKGWAFGLAGNLNEALRWVEPACQTLREMEEPFLLAGALIHLGELHLVPGSFQTAEEKLIEAVNIFSIDQSRYRWQSIYGLGLLGYCHTKRGHNQEGRSCIGLAAELLHGSKITDPSQTLLLADSRVAETRKMLGE